MHYESAKDVWDNLQAIHEGENSTSNIVKKEVHSSTKLTNNIVFKTFNVSKEETCSLLEDECDHEMASIISNRVTDSEEKWLDNEFNLKRKLVSALKKIESLKEKLQAYEKKDHNVNESKDTQAVTEQLNERKIHCEGLEAEIISLKTDLEKSNEQNKELLQVFEEQENGLKEEIIE